jgi:EAL and modified HD-GYP domain-containing signal transduction protein
MTDPCGRSQRSWSHERASKDVYVARQPIVNAAMKLYGYELLYRDGCEDRALFDDADAATYHVVVRAVLDIGLDALVGVGAAFVNATEGFLSATGYGLLPPERTVVEILEDVVVDDEVKGLVAEATLAGYRFALDDYTGPSSQDDIAPLVAFVKVDVPLVTEAGSSELRSLVDHVRGIAPQAQLIAEKVETLEEVQSCHGLGFDLFQGYFVGHPERRAGRQVPAGSQAALRLMAELERPDLSLGDLREALEGDPVLSYRLLRLVNAVTSAPRHGITSVHHALVLLGLDEVRRLATVLAMTTATAAPGHLIEQLVVRAKMCQRMAEASAGPEQIDPATAFTAGLFSELDHLFGLPMDRLLSDLPLSPSIQEALMGGDGAPGQTATSCQRLRQWQSGTCGFCGPVGRMVPCVR